MHPNYLPTPALLAKQRTPAHAFLCRTTIIYDVSIARKNLSSRHGPFGFDPLKIFLIIVILTRVTNNCQGFLYLRERIWKIANGDILIQLKFIFQDEQAYLSLDGPDGESLDRREALVKFPFLWRVSFGEGQCFSVDIGEKDRFSAKLSSVFIEDIVCAREDDIVGD